MAGSQRHIFDHITYCFWNSNLGASKGKYNRPDRIMTLSFAAFFALLLLRSHEVRSQSTLLRQGGGGGNSSSSQDVISTARKQKGNGFGDFTSPLVQTNQLRVYKYVIMKIQLFAKTTISPASNGGFATHFQPHFPEPAARSSSSTR
eukprot:scaffold1036_cov93-Cylindrotheca_fusiformis.AAC.5